MGIARYPPDSRAENAIFPGGSRFARWRGTLGLDRPKICKARGVTIAEDTSAQIHPHLPPLADLAELSLREREEALEAWVSWLNANPHLVTEDFESDLDRALHELDDDTVRETLRRDLHKRFSAWLETAGRPGAGRGPDEQLEDI